jgi:hypothetical protein
MSIDDVSDVAPRIQYTAASSQTDFDFPFAIFSDADLIVDVDGDPQALSTNYSVSGVGDDTGGTVTFLVALTGGEIVTVYRQTEIERTADYQQNGPLSSSSINDDFDKIYIIAQELRAAVQRALRIPLTAAVDDDDLELTPDNFAGAYLSFDADGKPVPAVLSASAVTQAIIANLLYPQLSAETSASATASNKVPRMVVHVDRYGADPTGTSDSTTAIQKATDYLASIGGGTVVFGEGTYRFTHIVPKTFVNWRGMGKYATTLDCRLTNGSVTDNVAIDARGSGLGGFPSDRKIVTLSDMTISGAHAGTQIQCLMLGWNMRSDPLLERVRIASFGHYGINFDDQNWNISFVNVEMDTCGSSVANSAGWFKKASVDGGTFNDIIWIGGFTEACGRSDSSAGGMNLQTTTANRSFKFFGHQWENNRGTDQVLITNTAGVFIQGPYIEMPSGAAEAVTGIELSGCTGVISGGFITAADSNNDQGVQVKGSSDVEIRGVHFGTTWNVACVDIQGSRVCAGRNIKSAGTAATYNLDSTAQVFGEVVPAFEAIKSANQTGIVTNTFTKVAYQTENWDDTSAYDNATNYRFTPKTIGRYLVEASVSWDTVETSGDAFVIAIYRNGSAYRVQTVRPYATQPFTHQISTEVNVTAATDYFEVFVRHLGTNNRTITADATATWFSARLLKAA